MAAGRAPHPKGGDPNLKELQLSLTAAEWRDLRLRAAEAGTSVQQIINEIVRRALER